MGFYNTPTFQAPAFVPSSVLALSRPGSSVTRRTSAFHIRFNGNTNIVHRRVRAPALCTASSHPPATEPTLSTLRSVTQVPVQPGSVKPLPQDYPLGEPSQPARFAPRHWFHGLRDDLRRRIPLYISDWREGFRFKSIPAILFLYFACLAPVVAFGGLTCSLTSGSIGVIEFLVSAGISGMAYATFSAQPLTVIAPTGLTLAFTTALFSFCKLYSLPFLPTYAWVGMWTAAILAIGAIINACDIIKYCTRFTDDIFNSLIATNFLYEASRSILTPFVLSGADKTNPFAALTLALGTFIVGRFLTAMRTSKYLFSQARNFLADFGPVLAIASMTFIASLPAITRIGLETLAIPSKFALSGGRPLLIPIFSAPLSVRLASIIPAVLLSCLFFLDQNISVRVVNSPANRLKKGPGYHIDLAVLSLTTFATSICGLPWMCAGTVQSLAHVRAVSELKLVKGEERIDSVMENRLTGFAVHAAIFGSLFLLPVVRKIPMAVISGLFLFLGVKMLGGNEFLSRTRYLIMDPKLYPSDSPMKRIPTFQVHSFTLLQVACLAMLWALKLNKKTSMFFPAVIATLMFIRSRIAPKLFPENALSILDGDIVGPDTPEEDVKQILNVPDRRVSAAN